MFWELPAPPSAYMERLRRGEQQLIPTRVQNTVGISDSIKRRKCSHRKFKAAEIAPPRGRIACTMGLRLAGVAAVTRLDF